MSKRMIEMTVEEGSRVVKDPLNPGIVHIEALVSFYEAAKLKLGNANVRRPEPNKKPYRAMLQTIEMEPQLFHLKNRGITYICTNARIEGNRVIVELPENNEDRYGIADGGHTWSAINNTVQNEKAFENITTWKMPFVRVHFLATKDQSDVESIVESLNTSSQVQNYTLDEYQGKFEELKTALEAAGFDPELVAFRENDDKAWDVREVVQRLSCFLKDRWLTAQPVGMYKSKNKALRLYTNEDSRAEFRKLYDVIKDVLTLPEYLQASFSRGGFVPGKSVAKLKCVKDLKKPDVRPGTNFSTMHKFDMAALLPMAAGFRELLVLKGDRYAWKVPFNELFEHNDYALGKDLYSLLVDRVALVPFSNQLGTDIEYWAGASTLVSRARNDITEEYPERYIVKKTRKRPLELEEEIGDGNGSSKPS